MEALNARQRAQSEKKEILTRKYVDIAKMMEVRFVGRAIAMSYELKVISLQLDMDRARNISCRDVRVKTWNENSKKTEIC